MSLPKGIHVFYLSAMKPPVGSRRMTGVNLYHLYFDGAAAVLNEQVPIESEKDLGRGVSAVSLGERISIQYIIKDENKLRKIFYTLGGNGKSSFSNGGYVPGVSTHDRTSPTYPTMSDFSLSYKNSDNGYLAFYGRGQHPFPTTIKIDYGPAAATLGDAIYVVCNQDKKILALRGAQGTFESNFVPNATLQNSPALVPLPLDDSVMLLHRSETTIWKSGLHGLYSNIYKAPTRKWSGELFVSEFPEKPVVSRPTYLNNSPGPCVYGDRVYCFMQGTDGNMWCQLYMGDRWTIDNTKVTVNGVAIPNIWYGPCAVAV